MHARERGEGRGGEGWGDGGAGGRDGTGGGEGEVVGGRGGGRGAGVVNHQGSFVLQPRVEGLSVVSPRRGCCCSC